MKPTNVPQNANPIPPRWATYLLTRLGHPDTREEVEGDLLELYSHWVHTLGTRRANWRYVLAVVGLLRPLAKSKHVPEYPSPFLLSPDMLRNYFKIAWRNLLKNKLYSLTTVLGLTIGLIACGLIALYIYDEWRVDRFHANADRIYRVVTINRSKGQSEMAAPTTGRPLAQVIQREVPGVEAVVPIRMTKFSVKHGNQYFFDNQLYAGEAFLKAFSYRLVAGDARTALRDPYSLVLTQSTAHKYFGDSPALGKTLQLADTLTFTVTGVLADPPPSHINFDVLLSLPTFAALGGKMDQWFTWDQYCYILLDKSADPTTVERTIAALPMKYNSSEYKSSGMYVEQVLEPLPKIYLHSTGGGINRPAGSAKQLYVLGAIGLFLLLLAGVNFINLTTAHQGERAKEVGVRKAIGAGTSLLIAQFIGESLLLALLAGVLAWGGVALSLPFFDRLTDKVIPFTLLIQPGALLASLLLVLLIGALAGWYPALILARFRPVDTLKGQVVKGTKGAWVRQGLVVFQFTVSLVLIISTLVASRQLHFMQGQALGFDKDRVLVVELKKLPWRQFIDNYATIKAQLIAIPNVQAVTGVTALPGRAGWNGQMVYPEGRPKEQALSLEVIPVDHDYVQVLGLTMRAGRSYDAQLAEDVQNGVLLNEAACKAFGWQPTEAVGKKIQTSGMNDGRVLGVIADFHQHGLQQAITPMLTFIAPYAYRYVALRLGPQDLSTSVGQVGQFWKERFPGYDFDYFFLDQDFNKQYEAEQRIATLFRGFAGLAIAIACMGLFALSTYTAQQRTKEIGVRKALGASVANIVSLLSKDFLKLVLVAIVIASPLAWYAMHRWLQDFAYKIEIRWWVFALAGGLAITIALLTVSYQSIRAALMNPVKSLRSE
ncbi:ABC transporter permease [Fibrella aquatilis]|uniref:ABC transporter permease n=1 Tax=Fibrella aquatilis TaxID=2817059 RepID=A0A939GBA4_9BACT|nr:ABC transporter permease [Fibrella aquatilis]MBO0934648.1 ABC transporter permease [Fibrella aquatilis]